MTVQALRQLARARLRRAALSGNSSPCSPSSLWRGDSSLRREQPMPIYDFLELGADFDAHVKPTATAVRASAMSAFFSFLLAPTTLRAYLDV